MGRPSKFTQAIADTICQRLAEGESLRTICETNGIPHAATVLRWLGEEDKAAFREQYMRAREAQADLYAEEIIQIADDGSNDTYITDNGPAVNHDVIARSRLRVDARKWYASKLAPKKYGDKVDLTHANPDGSALNMSVTFVKPK